MGSIVELSVEVLQIRYSLYVKRYWKWIIPAFCTH